MTSQFVYFTPDNDSKIAGLYNLQHTIGRGHYAVVKLAYHVFTGEKVAVKVIDKSKIDGLTQEQLFKEVVCMKLVQHPYVVRLYEVIDTPTKLYLILELGDGGDLYDFIMKHGCGLDERVAKRYFRQIITAIAYCHNLHVVHRDLKPENVVFFEKLGIVKLTDFGFSNKFSPGIQLDTSCGSLAYSAPEVLLGASYDAPKIDIWSLGVLLFMLVCGRLPFSEPNDSETLTKILDCDYTVPDHVSPSCRQLIYQLLVRDPSLRASLDDVLQADWLRMSDCNLSLTLFSVPLVSRECLSFEDHMEILTKMSDGSLATLDEIQGILDRNEYNHIAATYFLLAERKLKRNYITEYQRLKQLDAVDESATSSTDSGTSSIASNGQVKSVVNGDAQSSHTGFRFATTDERVRRFSMILEDAEEEEKEAEAAEQDYGARSHRSFLSRHLLFNGVDEDDVGEPADRKPGVDRQLDIDDAEDEDAEEAEAMITLASLAYVRSDVGIASPPALSEAGHTGSGRSSRRPGSQVSAGWGAESSDGAESDASTDPLASNSLRSGSRIKTIARPQSALRLSQRRSLYGSVGFAHKPLVTVRSSPHLLEHITEQDERIKMSADAVPVTKVTHALTAMNSSESRPRRVAGRHTLPYRPLTAYSSLSFMDDQQIGFKSLNSPQNSSLFHRQLSLTNSPNQARRQFAVSSGRHQPARPQSQLINWKTARQMSFLADLRRQSMCSSPGEPVAGASSVRRRQPSTHAPHMVDRRCSGPPMLLSPLSGLPLAFTASANASVAHTQTPSTRSESANSMSDRSDHQVLDQDLTKALDTEPEAVSPLLSAHRCVPTDSKFKSNSFSRCDPDQSESPCHVSSGYARPPNRLTPRWHPALPGSKTSMSLRSSAPLLCDLPLHQYPPDIVQASASPFVSSTQPKELLCTPIREEDESLRSPETGKHFQLNRRQSDSLKSLPKHHVSTSPGTTTAVTRLSIDADSDSFRSQPPVRHSIATSSALNNPAGGFFSAPFSSAMSSRLTNSNFSLASLGTSVSESRYMGDIIRGTFELQSYYNRLQGQQRPLTSAENSRSARASISTSVRNLVMGPATSVDYSTSLPVQSVPVTAVASRRPSRGNGGLSNSPSRRSSSANRPVKRLPPVLYPLTGLPPSPDDFSVVPEAHYLQEANRPSLVLSLPAPTSPPPPSHQKSSCIGKAKLLHRVSRSPGKSRLFASSTNNTAANSFLPGLDSRSLDGGVARSEGVDSPRGKHRSRTKSSQRRLPGTISCCSIS